MDLRVGQRLFVLIKSDSWCQSWVIGLYSSLQRAKDDAQDIEPERKFEWREWDDGAYARGGTEQGPHFSYSIEPTSIISMDL